MALMTRLPLLEQLNLNIILPKQLFPRPRKFSLYQPRLILQLLLTQPSLFQSQELEALPECNAASSLAVSLYLLREISHFSLHQPRLYLNLQPLPTVTTQPSLFQVSHAHTLKRSNAHTLKRSHAHTLTRSNAHTLTRSHAHTLKLNPPLSAAPPDLAQPSSAAPTAEPAAAQTQHTSARDAERVRVQPFQPASAPPVSQSAAPPDSAQPISGFTRSNAHTLKRSHAHTITRSHAHTLTRSLAHTLTRSHAHTLTRICSPSRLGPAFLCSPGSRACCSTNPAYLSPRC
jgi:hypothetical protein